MADNIPYVVDVVDAVDNGQPTKAYKTSDNRYLKIDQAQSEMASGRLAPPSQFTAKPVTGIPMKARTPAEYESMQKANQGAATKSNVAAYNEAVSSPMVGADVDASRGLLNRYNLAGTPEGEKAFGQRVKDITGIKAPAADIQRRMNFEFGPVTDVARGLRQREAQAEKTAQEAQSQYLQNAPSLLNAQHPDIMGIQKQYDEATKLGTPTPAEPTPFEKTAMSLGQEAVSGMPEREVLGRPMEKTEEAFAKAREASMQQEEKPVKPEKPPAAPKPPAKDKSIYGALSNNEIDALNRAIENGLDPHQINSRTGKIYANIEIRHPGNKWSALGASASYQRSGVASQTIALGESLYPLIDQLQTTYSRLENSQYPIVNKVINWAKEQSGDKNVVDFDNRRNDLVMEITRFATQVGAASDSRIVMLQEMLRREHSPAQFMAAANAAKALIDSRLSAIRAGPSGHGAGIQKTTGIPRGQQQPAGANVHPQASQAEQWAKQHPNDPRAKTILQLLGVQ